MGDEVVLLNFWASSFGMRVKIALAEKGVEYQYKEENLRDKSPFLLQIYICIKNILLSSSKEEEVKKTMKEFIEVLKVLEGELGDKPYFGGDDFGFVDVSFVPFYSWFYAIETFANFNIEAECPKLIAWAKKCMEKESVAKSLPDSLKIYDFAVQMKKIFGME
ncbi:hypothetical protein NE237_032427 [Protea cynaroides]|uniref:glutathione transferase n=1 Tax=Protea cynaroides TaxID=273540 RepID=A0A9Q0L3H4_9MAGN|nr:hypothetical protein NE237_032427 [Protea cynaroides]